VCRQSTGALVSTGVSTQVTAAELHVGDIDQDGRADLLALSQSASGGPSAARVLHFGEGGLPAATLSLPGEIWQPRLLSIGTSSATSAIFSNSTVGFSAILGQSNRSFVPKNYPSIPLAAEIRAATGLYVDALPSSVGGYGDEIILFSRLEAPGAPAENVLGNSDGSVVRPMAFLPDSPSSLIAGMRQGHLLWKKGPEHHCPEVVLAFQKAPEILLFTPCIHESGVARWATPEDKSFTKIQLPPGVKLPENTGLSRSPFVVDIDRDGLLDLLTEVEEPDGFTVLYAAYGTGLGYMVPRPGSTEQNHMGRLLIPLPAAGDPAPAEQRISVYGLQAVGHFDQDDALDFVGSSNLYTSADPAGMGQGYGEIYSEGGQSYAPVFPGYLGEYWSEVQVCDLNGDGRLDVVGARSSSALDVLLGNGKGGFSNGTVPLGGIPGATAVGDFDGDLLDDLVFRERTYTEDGEVDDTLTVLFGARQGLPSELVRMGRFGEILGTVPGLTFNPFSPDFTTDLGLFSRNGNQLIASQFFGASDRRLRSFLTLQSVGVDPQGKPVIDIDAPLGFTSARFAADASPGLVALGTSRFVFGGPGGVGPGGVGPGGELPGTGGSVGEDPRLRLWRLDREGDAEFAPLRSFVIPGAKDLENTITAGDLDGDGVDEVVVLLSSGVTALDAPPEGTPGGGKAGASTTALVFRVNAAAAPADPFELAASSPFQVPISIDSKMEVVDLDGDGLAELLLLNRRPEFLIFDDGTSTAGTTEETDEPPVASGEDTLSTIGALWVIRQTSPGVLDWSRPTRIELPEVDRQVTGFCVLPSEGTSRRLVVSTRAGLFLGQREGDSYRFSSYSGVLQGDIETLACGDFDGDGVQDVALSYYSSVEILRGLPRLP
jgi:hypothetical protein